jgi:PAS domain S-box-containing protein
MTWIDVVWPMMSAASLTLALIHVGSWYKQRDLTDHLALGMVCLGVGAIAILEWLMMRAQTPNEFATLLRWAHVPFALILVGLVAFVRVHFSAGRVWFGLLIIAAELASLIPNFLTGVNLNFLEITELHSIRVWKAGPISVPGGIPNPWMFLGLFTISALLVYLVDATMTVWRRDQPGERRRAIFVCGSMGLFLLFTMLWSFAVVRGAVRAPLIVVPAFIGALLVISYELGTAILQSALLAKKLVLAESNLRDSEQRMDLAVSAAGVGLWTWHIGQGQSWYSEPGLSMLGFAPGERVDQDRFLQRVHADDRQGVQDALAQATVSGGLYRNEYRIVGPDQQRRWIAARGQVEFNEKHQPLRVRGIVADITERGQAEENLRALVEASPTALLMVDTGGSITLANRQAETVFGYSREELMRMNVDDLVPSRYREWHVGDRAAYAADASVRPMGVGRELFARRKDDSEVPVEIALNPIHSEKGAFVLASILDISARKRTERELAVQRDELAHLSRVVMLAELSGSLAHELNQPMTAVLSNAQAALRFLAHSPPSLDDVRESLASIVENDKRAGEVIRRLRAMLRKEPAEHRRLDINDVVLDVLRIIRSDLLNRNVDMVLELAPTLPPIEGDRVQLQQVLLNLVMNATDAMQGVLKGREIKVQTVLTDANEVEVLVVDAGCGIPADELELVFSPFVTSKAGGMGLGLAVCTSIIQTHRGRIWATNNAERGATLHFSLPCIGNALHSG